MTVPIIDRVYALEANATITNEQNYTKLTVNNVNFIFFPMSLKKGPFA